MQPIDRSTPAELLIAALAGFSAFLFASALYSVVVLGNAHRQATSHQTVCAAVIGTGAGLLMIQAISLSQRRNPLRLSALPEGFVLGFLGSLVVIPLVLAATEIVQLIMRYAGAAAPEEHALLLVFQKSSSLDRLLVILSAVILAPLFEELIFRAHLQATIRRATSHRWPAIIVASSLFALVHGILWMMPPLFVLAIGLGYVYDRTKNIWASITMHALFNALSLTVEYYAMKHP